MLEEYSHELPFAPLPDLVVMNTTPLAPREP